MFQTIKPFLATLAALAIVLPAQISAHGTMSSPNVVFLDPYNKNAPSAMAAGPAGPYTGNAVIKDLADSKGSKCGKTDANAPVQPIPADGMVQLAVTAAHIGPCEVWLDNEMVASAKECVKEYPDRKIPVDFSKCKTGKCQVRWVWLATHNSPWEIYDNCANVGGGSGGDSSAGPVSPTTPSVTPAPSNDAVPTPKPSRFKKPSPSAAPSPAQGPSSAPPASDSDADAPGTVAPSPVDGAKHRGIDNSAALNWWCEINCERGYCPESVCVTA